jgi:SAM-dependent methyltransferase
VAVVRRLRAVLRRLERGLAPPPVPALELASGFWRACAVGALVRLGVPDRLADGPRDVRALALDIGADEDALFRLLRALADDGVLARTGRTFALTAVSQPLRTGTPRSVAASAAQMTAEWNLRAWSGLAESVRTGEPAFPRQHGTDLWEYLAGHPDEARHFHRSMRELSRLDVAPLLAAHDFARHATVVDVGGGSGELLAGVLAAHPHLRGVLQDQPSALEEAPDVLGRTGVADRCTVVAGDYREEVPPGGDVYLLRQVTHGHSDAQLAPVLAALRRAVPPHGRLLVLDTVVPARGSAESSTFLDLQMLVGSGGRERTRDEFARLLADGGFRLVGVTRTAGPTCVVTAEPAGPGPQPSVHRPARRPPTPAR